MLLHIVSHGFWLTWCFIIHCWIKANDCWNQPYLLWWRGEYFSKKTHVLAWGGQAAWAKWNFGKWRRYIEKTTFWCKVQGAQRSWHICSATRNQTQSNNSSHTWVEREHRHWRTSCMYHSKLLTLNIFHIFMTLPRNLKFGYFHSI